MKAWRCWVFLWLALARLGESRAPALRRGASSLAFARDSQLPLASAPDRIARLALLSRQLHRKVDDAQAPVQVAPAGESLWPAENPDPNSPYQVVDPNELMANMSADSEATLRAEADALLARIAELESANEQHTLSTADMTSRIEQLENELSTALQQAGVPVTTPILVPGPATVVTVFVPSPASESSSEAMIHDKLDALTNTIAQAHLAAPGPAPDGNDSMQSELEKLRELTQRLVEKLTDTVTVGHTIADAASPGAVLNEGAETPEVHHHHWHYGYGAAAPAAAPTVPNVLPLLGPPMPLGLGPAPKPANLEDERRAELVKPVEKAAAPAPSPAGPCSQPCVASVTSSCCIDNLALRVHALEVQQAFDARLSKLEAAHQAQVGGPVVAAAGGVPTPPKVVFVPQPASAPAFAKAPPDNMNAPSPAAQEPLVITMTVQNVDYSQLEANLDVLTAFEEHVKMAIADWAGSLPIKDVTLVLVPGPSSGSQSGNQSAPSPAAPAAQPGSSTNIKATVALHSNNPEAAEHLRSQQFGLSLRVQMGIKSIGGLEVVSSGPVNAVDIWVGPQSAHAPSPAGAAGLAAAIGSLPQGSATVKSADMSDLEARLARLVTHLEELSKVQIDLMNQMAGLPPAPEVDTVALSFVVSGVDYTKLIDDPVLKDEFDSEMRKKIATNAGVSIENVAVVMSAGSVKVISQITPPAEVQASSLSATLKEASSKLSDDVMASVKALPGIDAVSTGSIGIEDMEEPVVQSPKVGGSSPSPAVLTVGDAVGGLTQRVAATADRAQLDHEAYLEKAQEIHAQMIALVNKSDATYLERLKEIEKIEKDMAEDAAKTKDELKKLGEEAEERMIVQRELMEKKTEEYLNRMFHLDARATGAANQAVKAAVASTAGRLGDLVAPASAQIAQSAAQGAAASSAAAVQASQAAAASANAAITTASQAHDVATGAQREVRALRRDLRIAAEARARELAKVRIPPPTFPR